MVILAIAISGSTPLSAQNEFIKIGLLVPDQSSPEIIYAAKTAIEEANLKGGYRGQSFKLAIRTTDGPWGAGSKESVSLVYEDNVRAIVGSLDGRNAHLAEQVATKSHLVYLETRATDPTLSQAFVPWFFRVVPNDDQQSRAILEMIKNKGGRKIGILSASDYDTRYAVKSLTKYAALGGENPLILSVESGTSEAAVLIQQIMAEQINHLIVPFYSEATKEIVVQLVEKMPELHLYGTLAFTSEMEREGNDWEGCEGMVLVRSYDESHRSSHNLLTGISSLYTCDGMNLVIEAILHVGPERESIKDWLVTMSFPQGETGPVTFDDMGNRNGTIGFIQILNSKAVPVN